MKTTRKKARRLPVLCLNAGDDLSVEGYLAKAAARGYKSLVLTDEETARLEYSLRVFRGLRAVMAAQPLEIHPPKKKKQKTLKTVKTKRPRETKEKRTNGYQKSSTGLSGRRLRRRFSGGAPRIHPSPATQT